MNEYPNLAHICTINSADLEGKAAPPLTRDEFIRFCVRVSGMGPWSEENQRKYRLQTAQYLLGLGRSFASKRKAVRTRLLAKAEELAR